MDPTDEHFLFQINCEGEAQHRTRTISTTIAVNAPHGVAAALFSPLSFFRPSARSFNIVGKSCGAALLVPYHSQFQPPHSCRCRMELLILMKKTKGGRKIFVPSRRPKSEDRKRDQKRSSKLLWGIRACVRGPRPPTFCLTAITAAAGADIAVITRLTKVFPHRRCCTSIVHPSVRPFFRPSMIAFFDKSLTHFGKLF